MIKIAVIKKNQCKFDRLEEFIAPLLYRKIDRDERHLLKQKLNNYLWSIIEPYVSFIDIDCSDGSDFNQKFLETVCCQMAECFEGRNVDDLYYHTEASYSFPKKYIELMRCQPLWGDYIPNNVLNVNSIGCFFSLKHTFIENTCVIIANKYDLTAKKFAIIDSINAEDILRVIRRRFYFSSAVIKNNKISKYYYQDPKYLIQEMYGLTEKDNIEHFSFNLLKYNLIYYFQNDKMKYTNEIATRISGTDRFYGDVIVLHEMEENIYANLSIRELKRLNVLTYGKLSDRNLVPNEEHSIETMSIDENGKEISDKTIPLWSRYIVIDNRINQWQHTKNKCIYCKDTIITPITCPKCFRAKYCSVNCIDKYNNDHQKECIDN